MNNVKVKSRLNKVIILSIITLFGCKEDNFQSMQLPSIDQIIITNISGTYASLTSVAIQDNGPAITERGFCWSTSPNPDINNNRISVGSGLGEFSSPIEGLDINTIYYAKSYAINETGIQYSKEEKFTTLNKVEFQIEENRLDDNILYNSQDKLIYFITFNENSTGNTTYYKINAFNYDLKEVSVQRKIEGTYSDKSPRNSIGVYNNQIEIYMISGNKLTILNGIDLTEITSLTIPNSNLSSVKIKDGLLFISYIIGYNNFVSVYNRQDFTLINEAGDSAYNPNYGYLIVYQDILNENQIKCASFPRNSNSNLFQEFVFDNQGNYLDHNSGVINNSIVNYNNVFAKTNDNVDFILTGTSGTIHKKNNLSANEKSKLNNTGEFTDYFISEDGDYIYSIQRDSSINKYNASTFTLEDSLPINENGSNILVDKNQLIIVDYNLYPSIEVSFSFYPN